MRVTMGIKEGIETDEADMHIPILNWKSCVLPIPMPSQSKVLR